MVVLGVLLLYKACHGMIVTMTGIFQKIILLNVIVIHNTNIGRLLMAWHGNC